MAGFIVIFLDKNATPSFLKWLMIHLSSLYLIKKETGCCIRTSCYFSTTLRVVPSDKFRRYRPRGRPLSCFVGILLDS